MRRERDIEKIGIRSERLTLDIALYQDLFDCIAVDCRFYEFIINS